MVRVLSPSFSKPSNADRSRAWNWFFPMRVTISSLFCCAARFYRTWNFHWSRSGSTSSSASAGLDAHSMGFWCWELCRISRTASYWVLFWATICPADWVAGNASDSSAQSGSSSFDWGCCSANIAVFCAVSLIWVSVYFGVVSLFGNAFESPDATIGVYWGAARAAVEYVMINVASNTWP